MSDVVANTGEVIPITGNLREVVAEIPEGEVFVVRIAEPEYDDFLGTLVHYEWAAGRLASRGTTDPYVLGTSYYIGHSECLPASKANKSGLSRFIGHGALHLSNPIDFQANEARTYFEVEYDGPQDVWSEPISKIERPRVEVVLGKAAAQMVETRFGEGVLNELADPDSNYITMLDRHHMSIFPPHIYQGLYTSRPVPDLGKMMTSAFNLTKSTS